MKSLIILLFATFTMCVSAQSPREIQVWPNGPVESSGMVAPEKVASNGSISNSNEARLYVYLPEKSKSIGVTVLICPGGGYGGLAMKHEGYDVAKWLNTFGVAGVVLKYRMPNAHSGIPLEDAKESMRIIRSNAKEWGLDPHRVGVCGFSAGGHLASTLSVRSDSTTNPDFSILFYPVISMKDGVTHNGSRANLLGANPPEDKLEFYSNEKQVTKKTPSTFLILADDDKAVVPENSISYYQALKKNGVPATMYIFPSGGHGFGFKPEFQYHEQMKQLLKGWILRFSK